MRITVLSHFEGQEGSQPLARFSTRGLVDLSKPRVGAALAFACMQRKPSSLT